MKLINNLFSSFDPSTSLNINLNWLSALLGTLFLPVTFWRLPSRWTTLLFSASIFLHKEFQTLLNSKKPEVTILPVRLFLLILFNNMIGLVPYIFTGTRHIVITLSLSLPLWLAVILYGFQTDTKHILAHLVPTGTPGALSPLIVIIESIRTLIRPGTLAIRLIANITAGHLLITLSRGAGPSLSAFLSLPLIICQIPLLCLELAVAVIQSFVFSALLTLYIAELASAPSIKN